MGVRVRAGTNRGGDRKRRARTGGGGGGGGQRRGTTGGGRFGSGLQPLLNRRGGR